MCTGAVEAFVDDYFPCDVRGTDDLGLRHTMAMWATDSCAQFVEVLMLTSFYIYRDQIGISELMGMRAGDLVFFLLFTSVVVAIEWALEAPVNNMLEMLHGWQASPPSTGHGTHHPP